MSGASQDLLVAVGLFVMLLVALEGGFRAGRRSRREEDAKSAGQIGAIQGAVLGLLGLLLAFSFAAAGSRFLERQDLIVAEANAIGTAFLRSQLLDETDGRQLRTALRTYTEHRIEASKLLRGGLSAADLAQVEHLQADIWAPALRGVQNKPAVTLAVLEPVNEVIDLHSLRMAAGRKHIPKLVLGLLIACSAISIAVIGYACGVGEKRRLPMTLSLAFLIGTALWITIDLDHPRGGFMQLSDGPLKALDLAEPPAAGPK